jgi:hypothetical protein
MQEVADRLTGLVLNMVQARKTRGRRNKKETA